MSCPSWQWNRTGSYVWSPCGVTWDLSQPVMVIKLQLKPTYLSQSYLKIFIGYYFQSHWILKFPPKKNLSHFAKILGYPLISSDGMDSDQLVYVLLSVFGEKIAFFSLNSKNVVSSIQSLGKLEGLRQLGYLICVQLIMLKDWAHIFIKTRRLAWCVKFWFFALQSSAGVCRPPKATSHPYAHNDSWQPKKH